MIINANQGSGGGNLQPTVTVTPSTSTQSIKSDPPYNGLSEVIVNPAPLEAATVKSSTAAQPAITPTAPNIGFSSITVEPNLLQTKAVTLPTSQPIQPDAGYYGLSAVNVSAPLYPLNVTPTSTQQTFNVPSGYYGHGTVTVEAAPQNTGWYQVLTLSKTTSYSVLNPGGITTGSVCMIMSQSKNLDYDSIKCLQIYAGYFWKGVIGGGDFLAQSDFSGGNISINSSTISITLPQYNGTQLYFDDKYYITFSGTKIP